MALRKSTPDGDLPTCASQYGTSTVCGQSKATTMVQARRLGSLPEHLGADIACFQETKMTRKQLTEPMCILHPLTLSSTFILPKATLAPSHTSARAFQHRSKPSKGSQAASPVTKFLRICDPNEPIGFVPADTRDDVERRLERTRRGRPMCSARFGRFVLFNVYCPTKRDLSDWITR